MRLRTHIILVTGLTLITVAVLFGFAEFRAEERMLLRSMDDKLLTAALLAKEILPPDYHDKITGATSVSDTEYRQIVNRWNRLCKELGLEYIWSLMRVDGKTVFTSGSSTSKDINQGDYARFFETHSNPEFYVTAFTTLQPQYQINNDKWGRIKVVLLPFKDAHNRPCLFGTSMKMTEVDSLMKKTFWQSARISLGVLLFGIAFNVLFARSLARPLETLSKLTKRIREGNWEPVAVTSCTLEIRSLEENINTMIQSIQEKINQRQQAEETLRASEEKYRFLTENSSDVIWHLDHTCRFDYISPTDERLRKFKREEVIGKTFWSLLKPESAEYIKRMNAQRLCDEQNGVKTITKRYELEQICGDGNWVWTEINVTPHHDQNGKLIGYYGVTRDISERKRSEAERLKMQKLQSVGTLAGGIAHDFNNILMGLYGNIALAKEDLPHDHPGYKSLEEAGKSMNRAIRLTKQLLTFAKGGDPVKGNVSLGVLFEEVARFDLSGSPVKLVYRQAKDLWQVEVDKGQIEQVVSNLIINARQTLSQGGNLYVTLANANVPEGVVPGLKSGKHVEVTVRDDGPGIDQKILDRIFDPYFTTKETGNGLGLATVYAIINKHGGHIGVVSETGKGTTFTFYLPASDSQQRTETKRIVVENRPLNHPAKILVMDDEEAVCSLIVKMLDRYDFSVTTVLDGKKAIEAFQQAREAGEPFDAVILDLTVPGGIGGKEVIKELLAIDPKTKAIVSSGYAEDPVMANYATYGFKGIVVKPYTQSELLNMLRLVLP